MLRCITINTDASYHPIHKVGGYAFYIISDLFKITKGGMFKKEPKNPEEAEMMCIGNAVATLLAQKELPKCKMIVLNCDAKFAMNKIKAGANPMASKVQSLCSQLTKRTGVLKIHFRQVKAHHGTPDPRSWVNDWCDKEAKKWMREKVKTIQTQEA
jgi:ribonuclease HI